MTQNEVLKGAKKVLGNRMNIRTATRTFWLQIHSFFARMQWSYIRFQPQNVVWELLEFPCFTLRTNWCPIFKLVENERKHTLPPWSSIIFTILNIWNILNFNLFTRIRLDTLYIPILLHNSIWLLFKLIYS